MPFKVAEFTTNHMGNLNVLLRMVEKAKWAGADIIKMQQKDVESFYTQEKLNSPYPSPYGKTYRDYRAIFEFDLEDWKRFDAKCKAEDIPWFVTLQDIKSCEWFYKNNFNLPMVKVASVNSRNIELLDTIKNYFPKAAVVVSIGGTELTAVDDIVDFFEGRDLYIQQCTSTYPCPLDQLNLGNIPLLIERYKGFPNVHIGYSGHEKGYVPSVIAAQLGAETIERHFCLSRHSFVHHIECSLEPKEFKEMTSLIDNLPTMLSSNFGMKESEKKFLIEGSYSKEFLGEKSKIK